MPTVSNHDGVDEKSQESGLVGSGVVLQQRRGVVVTDRRVGRALGNCSAGSCEDGEEGVGEMHIGTIVEIIV